MNRKGMTLIEIIVSIALISIILIFLLNLFLNIRKSFDTLEKEVDYSVISSTIIKAIGDDMRGYGLESVKYAETAINHETIILTFNDYRPSKLSSQIQKVLKIYEDDYHKKFISYQYDPLYTDMKDITGKERLTNVTRQLPNDVILDERNFIQLIEDKEINAIEIKIPMMSGNYTKYDINIYGLFS